jgi:hypothetical protein
VGSGAIRCALKYGSRMETNPLQRLDMVESVGASPLSPGERPQGLSLLNHQPAGGLFSNALLVQHNGEKRLVDFDFAVVLDEA